MKACLVSVLSHSATLTIVTTPHSLTVSTLSLHQQQRQQQVFGFDDIQQESLFDI